MNLIYIEYINLQFKLINLFKSVIKIIIKIIFILYIFKLFNKFKLI